MELHDQGRYSGAAWFSGALCLTVDTMPQWVCSRFKSFKSVTICSVVLSVVCALAGMFISIITVTPVGSTIVAADMVVFGICCLIGRLCEGNR